MRVPLAVLAVACAVAGCGGSDDTPRNAVRQYLSGLASGDGGKACGRLTPASQRAVAATGTGSSSCEDVVHTAAARLPAAAKSRLLTAEVDVVRSTGSTATTRIVGGSTDVQLVKSGDRWEISNLHIATGGLGGLLTGTSDDQATAAIRKRIADAQAALGRNPRDRAALATVVRARYQLATVTGSDTQTGEFRAEARGDLLKSVTAWKRYESLSTRPAPDLARIALQAYDGLGRLEHDHATAVTYWAGASDAAELLALRRPSAQTYLLLVEYASLAGQTRKADLAGNRAIALAPPGQRAQVRQAVNQAKASAVTQTP